jgi:hypothetical protein
MKTLHVTLSALPLLGAFGLACSTPSTDLPLDDPCAAVGLDQVEYQPLGQGNMGSFEDGMIVSEGALIIDDDDLTDDYPVWKQGVALHEELVAAYPAEVALFDGLVAKAEQAGGSYPAEFYTAEEQAAVDQVTELGLDVQAVCPYYALPVPGEDEFSPPTFVNCKDKWNRSGDGVIGLVSLAETGRVGDAELSACGTVLGAPNARALNFWGPLSVDEATVEGAPNVPKDGFSYSGITVPLVIAPYKQTIDISAWDGIAFWARTARADEAVPIQDTPGDRGQPPLGGRPIPVGARPMDGVGQLGITIQTLDTAALDNGDGAHAIRVCAEGDVSSATSPCFASQAEMDAFDTELVTTDASGEPVEPFKWGVVDQYGEKVPAPLPFCQDYSPVDAVVGEETPFRDQCWDGFRRMLEVTQDWKFYFIPFEQMRQAGWGRVGTSFRLEQVRSINLLTSAFQSVNVMVDEVALYRRRP